MVKASNQKSREQIVIPHGTKLSEIAHHVHYKCGGLYSAGLGYYLQGDYWYVYPCYDTTRFAEADKTLTVINVPPNRMPGIERTYRLDGTNLVALATGKIKFRDSTNELQLNHGNGVRFVDADTLMEKFVQTTGNKAIAARGRTNSEFIAEKRVNGKNFVASGLKPINANPYVEYSALAKRQGSLITLVWENANRALLYPGMPTKIMYLDGEEIKVLYGVLLHVHVFVSLKDPGIEARRYATNLMLGVFVKPLDEATAA
jgi:hypothetical protein